MTFQVPAGVCAMMITGVMLVCLGCRSNQAQDGAAFARKFTENASSSYEFSLAGLGGGAGAEGSMAEKVLSVSSTSATVEYKLLSAKAGGVEGISEGLPTWKLKVGPDGLPQGTKLTGAQMMVTFASIAGMTPNRAVAVGQPFTVHYKGENYSVEGDGKMTNVDDVTKTATVDWKLNISTTGFPNCTMKVISVYDRADYSLKSSKGAITIIGTDCAFKVNRLKADSP